jgi:hypothetical protein
VIYVICIDLSSFRFLYLTFDSPRLSICNLHCLSLIISGKFHSKLRCKKHSEDSCICHHMSLSPNLTSHLRLNDFLTISKPIFKISTNLFEKRRGGVVEMFHDVVKQQEQPGEVQQLGIFERTSRDLRAAQHPTS